tara:strand:- start:413 stop:613 length:201 start_codon:yes stop_codon:yes gene_type:complete
MIYVIVNVEEIVDFPDPDDFQDSRWVINKIVSVHETRKGAEEFYKVYRNAHGSRVDLEIREMEVLK